VIDFATIRNQNSMLDVASRYIELKRRGSEYVALCPFHGEKTPSFTVYPSRDGLMRFRCFGCGAGSDGGDVIDFVSAIEGIEVSEACKRLSDGALPHVGTFKPPLPPAVDQSQSWRPIVPVPDDAPEYDPARTFNPRRGATVAYQVTRKDAYRDANGRLLCWVVRLEFDDGKKICPTITYCVGPGGDKRWTAKRMEPPYPLQGLDDLAARPSDCVLLVSGEKCREAAAEHMKNFVAVTWLGGDQAVGSADIEPLKGRYIVYWPDADPSSKRSMVDVRNRIRA
jgi:hypothetical protein